MLPINSGSTLTISDSFSLTLRVQHNLEVSTKQAIFLGSSVSDTIKTCIAMGNERAAVKVKSEFKVLKIVFNHFSLADDYSNADFVMPMMLLRFLIKGGTG
jgi:hypothetical protein